MSRSGGETIIVRPTNNVYTVLVAVALVVEIVGFIMFFARAKTLGISLF
jgi:hypothetical protein